MSAMCEQVREVVTVHYVVGLWAMDVLHNTLPSVSAITRVVPCLRSAHTIYQYNNTVASLGYTTQYTSDISAPQGKLDPLINLLV